MNRVGTGCSGYEDVVTSISAAVFREALVPGRAEREIGELTGACGTQTIAGRITARRRPGFYF